MDAQLTNGADVAITARSATTGVPDSLLGQVRALPKVAAAEPLQRRHADVGNDLQGLFGVNPETVGTATALSDAYFSGVSARQALAALRARPDGLLVSEETMKDFQLTRGDLVRLRLQSAADGSHHSVAFHFIGVVREFPTAPRTLSSSSMRAWTSPTSAPSRGWRSSSGTSLAPPAGETGSRDRSQSMDDNLLCVIRGHYYPSPHKEGSPCSCYSSSGTKGGRLGSSRASNSAWEWTPRRR